MSITNRLTLSIEGAPALIDSLNQEFPTRIMLFDELDIGRRFFDELPEKIEKELDSKKDGYIYYYENDADSGEIQISRFIKIIELLETTEIEEENNWKINFEKTLTPIKEKLKLYIEKELIEDYETVQFRIY